jgi:hypothetical protein
MDNNQDPIYRYKFADDVSAELDRFSKVHQYDDRVTFKEAWAEWTNDNEDLVSGEVQRLTNLGYDGDVVDKMFKSARYYYRKKSTEKKTPAKRRNYVGVQKELLEAMDKYISETDSKPAVGFVDFCKAHMDLLKTEIDILRANGITERKDIENKIKKTYKNRYFMQIKS